MSSQKSRIFEFDFIRVASILYIIIHHTRDYAYSYQVNIVDEILTSIALSLFVFISGYLITASPLSLRTRTDIVEWLKKRFIRLYPLYFASTLLYVVYYFHDLNVIMTMAQILCLNLIISPWFGDSFRTIWFASMIMLYYLFFAASFYQRKRWTPYLKICTILGALIVGRILWGLVEDRLILYFPIFIAGLWSGDNLLLSKPISNRVFFLGLVSCIAASMAYPALRENALYRSIDQAVIGLLAVIPVWRGTQYLGSKITNHSPVLFLSYASYGMYLFHRFIFRAILILYYPKTTNEMYFYLLVCGIPMVIVFGYLIQRVYDHMINQLINSQKITA